MASGDWRPAATSALVGALLFAVTLGGTYVYDDLHVLFIDKRMGDPTLWGQFWTQPYFPHAVDNLYRPLVSLSYAVQLWLHGDRAWAFHLVNVLLHAGACAAVAELGRRLAGTRVAYVAGLLFAAHPVHVEAVANVVGRAELMCTAATLTALVLFAKHPMTAGRGAAIVICFAAAVLSKEQGLLLPLILASWTAATYGWPATKGNPAKKGTFLLSDDRTKSPAFSERYEDATPPPEKNRNVPFLRPVPFSRPVRSAVALVATMWLLLCGYLAWRETMFTFSWDRNQLDWTLNPMIRAQGVHRWLLMPLVLLGRYAALLAAPVKLSPDYGGHIVGWIARAGDPYLWLGIAVASGWCATMFLAVRRRAVVLALLLLGLALTYGMVSNVIIIGINVGERLMYLPSAFAVLLAATALARLNRRTVCAVAGVALALASVRTVTYAHRWNDRLGFYFACLEEQPNSIRLHLLLADELALRKDADSANKILAAAQKLMPEYWAVWIQSAQMATDQGRLEDAVSYLNRAVQADPTRTMFFNQVAQRIQEKHAAMQTAQIDVR